MRPTNLRKLYTQSKGLKARVINAHTVAVTSVTSPQANHIVTVDYEADGTIQARCTCPWAIHGGVACSHVMAALEALAAKRGRKLSFWRSRDEARRQKRRIFCLRSAAPSEEGIWITSRAA
ncbi:MAG: SWIM zinc finger family protein [Chloroflexi bacterium]|nr:SWIM zinc finger family protein [Chloroflexota bacterium]